MMIRPATVQDAEAIATIHVRSWQHAYRDILPADFLEQLNIQERIEEWKRRLAPSLSSTTAVAVVDDEVIGFAGWGPGDEPDLPESTPMLYSIYLHPSHMGKGAGTELLRHAESRMHGTATLRVLTENLATRGFYEHHGWTVEPGTERDETWFNTVLHTVRYRKHLPVSPEERGNDR